MSVQETLTQISNNTTRVYAEKAKTRTDNSELDQDAFLQLLMQQLKSQDPLNPMDNSEFISQTTQFSTLNQLQDINKQLNYSSNFMQASSIMGKEVKLQDPDDHMKTISGEVTEAKITKDDTSITVNNIEYPLSSVIGLK